MIMVDAGNVKFRHNGLDDEEDPDAAEEAAYWAHAEGRDHADYGEPAMGRLGQMADDIQAGRVEPPPGWKLDGFSPGVQVWTTPSGRRYARDPAGELLPLPDGEPAFRVPGGGTGHLRRT
jgi:hypothetical protein